MLTLLAWIAFFAFVITAIFLRWSAKVLILSVALVLLLYSYEHFISYVSLAILWLLWLVVAILLFVDTLRLKYMSAPFLQWFAKQQPPLSESEKQVLEAGGIWWEKQFFQGQPDWVALHALPKPSLTSAEQAFIDHQVHKLCEMIDDWKVVHDDNDLSAQVWDYIKQERFWGLVIDPQYGGHGFSAIAHSSIVSKIASRSLSAAFTIMVPNSLGPAEFLTHYGTTQQRDYYLPRLVRGEEIPCFALTSLWSGSDATSINDTGIVCKDMHEGQEIIGIRLNWDKRYITLAPVATLLGLAFKLYDPEHLIGETTNIGITLALVPANRVGVETGKRHLPLNLAFMNGPTRGKDVFIPLDWVIGGQNRIGQGWQMMMECLAIGRGISLPSLATASAKLSLRTSTAYARIRRQFNRPIGDFEGIAEALARIGGFTYLCEATRLFTAQAVAEGIRPAVASAIAKYHLTELSRKIIADAMDIHAGRAVQLGPRNYLGNLYQGIPISVAVEGANILTRCLIIFGQGVVRAHPFLAHELAAMGELMETKRLKQFDYWLFRHVGFVLSQFIRLLVYSLTGGRWIRAPKSGALANCYRQVTRMSTAFVVICDASLAVLGSQLKIKESLSARLGDVLSHLYMACAVLKYFKDQGNQTDEVALVQWSIDYCLWRIEQAMRELLVNFPIRWLGKFMRWIIFPGGQTYTYPKDQLGMKIAKLIQEYGPLRDRLTQYCYIGKNVSDPTGRMEAAMQALQGCDSALAKIRQSVKDENAIEKAFKEKTITAEEREQCLQALALYQDAIMVDEFVHTKRTEL